MTPAGVQGGGPLGGSPPNPLDPNGLPYSVARHHSRPEEVPRGTCGRDPALRLAEDAMQEVEKKRIQPLLGLLGTHISAYGCVGAPPMNPLEHCRDISTPLPPSGRSINSLQGSAGLVVVFLHGGQERHLCCTRVE